MYMKAFSKYLRILKHEPVFEGEEGSPEFPDKNVSEVRFGTILLRHEINFLMFVNSG